MIIIRVLLIEVVRSTHHAGTREGYQEERYKQKSHQFHNLLLWPYIFMETIAYLMCMKYSGCYS